MQKPAIIRIGLIGLGGMSNAHRMMINELEDLSVHAICDVNQDLLHQIGKAEGIPINRRYGDMEALIADSEVDAVIAALPNVLHARVLELCIQYGVPVMAEKPFTLHFKEAETLKELYEKSPIPCMVGFSYRYVPSFRYAKQLLKQNKIGMIRHMTIRYLQSFGAPLFHVPHTWRFEKAMSGTGALGDLGTHMIDGARFFAGEFRSVFATMETFTKEREDPANGGMKQVDVDDYVAFQSVMENGVIGQFFTTRHAVGSNNQFDITFYGDYGTIYVNNERPNEIDICVQEDTEIGPVFKTEAVPDEYLKQQLSDFVNLVLGHPSEDTPTFYDGYKNQKIMDWIIQSAETGRIVGKDQVM